MNFCNMEYFLVPNYSIVFDFIEIIFVLTRKKRREIWKTDQGSR
jgi:hypothetical protein